MVFIRPCFGGPNTLESHETLRDKYRAYRQSSVVDLIEAGSLLSDDGSGSNIASFIIFKAPHLAAAKAFHDGGPFAKAGVYATTYVHEWDKHAG